MRLSSLQLNDAIKFFETLILNLPGIKDLCPLILNDIIKPVIAPVMNAIVGIWRWRSSDAMSGEFAG